MRPRKLSGSDVGVGAHHARGARRPAAARDRRPGGVVQGVYAQRCGPLTVYLLDYDDLRADDDLAEEVARTGELPQVLVEAGLAPRGGRVPRRGREPGATSTGRDRPMRVTPFQVMSG